MLKILYITNKIIEQHSNLKIPINFELEYFVFEKNKIVEISHLYVKYDYFLIDIDIYDIEYNNYLKTIIEYNPNLNFWGICKQANKEEILHARNLGIYDLLMYPIQSDTFINKTSKQLETTTNMNYFEELNNANLLVIEENNKNIKLVSKILDIFKINIFSSLNKKENYEFLTLKKFDLIIINANLYNNELIQVIKKSKYNNETPILFITNDSLFYREFDITTFKIYNYIEKPIEKNKLQKQVYNIIKLEKLKTLLWTEKEKFDKLMQFSTNEIIVMDVNFDIISRNNKVLLFCENIKNLQNFLWLEPRITNAQFLNFKVSDLERLKLKAQVKISNEYIYVDINLTKLFNKEHKLTGFMAVIQDKTEDIEIEQQKDTFIATLTHDLKTPIQAQIQALDLLIKEQFGKIPDEAKNVLEEIQISCNFMKNMTENLLLKYKSDKGELKIIKEKNNLKQLLEKCTEKLIYILFQKQQMLCVNYKTPIEVFEFDECELERVINNLIIHAAEHTPNKDRITINILTNNNNEIEIEIIDGGIGMTEEYCNIIFDKFVSSVKKYRKIGSGLGLYISKRIIKAHGGDIKVMPQENIGTKFTITLPLTDKPVANVDIDKFKKQ